MHIQSKDQLAKHAQEEYSRAAARMSHNQALEHVAAVLHLTVDAAEDLIDHVTEVA